MVVFCRRSPRGRLIRLHLFFRHAERLSVRLLSKPYMIISSSALPYGARFGTDEIKHARELIVQCGGSPEAVRSGFGGFGPVFYLWRACVRQPGGWVVGGVLYSAGGLPQLVSSTFGEF